MAVRAARSYLHLLCRKAGGCDVLPSGQVPSSISWGIADTGASYTALAWAGDALVCLLPFFRDAHEAGQALQEDLDASWSGLPRNRDDRDAAARFASWDSPDASTHVLLAGTALQLSVWQALAMTAPGERFSYRELASRVSHPQAIRAVASCVARNPVSLVIPCHRIVPSSGGVGKYRWGSGQKHSLLEVEAQAAIQS